MLPRLSALLALTLAATACDETPGDLPPCVDPTSPCTLDAATATVSDASGNDRTVLDAGDAASSDAGPDALTSASDASGEEVATHALGAAAEAGD